jgi:hypothetical protein
MNLKNKEIEMQHTCNCCSPRFYDSAHFTADGIIGKKLNLLYGRKNE